VASGSANATSDLNLTTTNRLRATTIRRTVGRAGANTRPLLFLHPHIAAVHTAMHPLCTLPMHAGIGRCPYDSASQWRRLSPRPHPAFAIANALPACLSTARRSAPAGVDALPLTTTIVSGTVPIKSVQTVALFTHPTLNGPVKPSRQRQQLDHTSADTERQPTGATAPADAILHRHPAFAACLFPHSGYQLSRKHRPASAGVCVSPVRTLRIQPQGVD
jgi:hypothetical protein